MGTTESAGALNFTIEHRSVFFSGKLTLEQIDRRGKYILKELRKFPRDSLTLNLDNLESIDSSGVAFLEHIRRELSPKKIDVHIETGRDDIRNVLKTFTIPEAVMPLSHEPLGFFERIGENVYHFFKSNFREYVFLMADIFVWTFTDIFEKKQHRKGEFVNQAVLIGVNAIPIVGLISFMIGLVLALQSAAQLRQFGANIFIVDLVVIAMTREMGPLLTAIMIAGRSGSAIASEVATMKVTEEVDALKTMALNPVRFIVIPKMHASICTLPFLTILANLFGIVGGMVIARFYLDIAFPVFFSRMVTVLYLKDLATGIFKSLIFSGIIVQTGAFYGFRVTGGAEGVGRFTTSAVVTSIFLVILADSIIGLMFY